DARANGRFCRPIGIKETPSSGPLRYDLCCARLARCDYGLQMAQAFLPHYREDSRGQGHDCDLIPSQDPQQILSSHQALMIIEMQAPSCCQCTEDLPDRGIKA